MTKNVLLLYAATLFLILAFAGVVAVGPHTFFPYSGVKLFWFRTAVSLAIISLGGWAFRASSEEVMGRIKRLGSSLLVRAVTGFAAVFLLTTAFAYNPYLAFWSNFERGEGGFQMIYYYIFFLLLIVVVDTKKGWRKFRAGIIASTFLVIGYGVFSAFGGAIGGRFFFGLAGFSSLVNERFSGSIGNAGFAGSFFLLSLWWVSLACVEEVSVRKRYWWLGAIAILAFFLFLTQTRGAILGLFAGIIVFWGYFMWGRGWFRGILGLIIVVFAMLGMAYISRPIIKNVPVLGRASRFSLGDRSIQARFLLWQTTVSGFKERPVLGWGPENFPIVFDRYFDTRHVVPGETSDTWYDRAHNVFLDYLVGTGIVGLLGYLGIFAAYYLQFFRSVRAGLFSHLPLEQALFFIFPIIYLIPLLLIFDLFPTYIHLFSFLAFAHYRFSRTILS